VSEYHDNDVDIEFITIVEGPTPDFAPTSSQWPLGLQEGPISTSCAVCKLRTFDGEAMAARCHNAWKEGRPVRLDYPDQQGVRQEVDIIAVRTETVDDGDVLYLWTCV
jgi:hypothetical protein